MLTFSLRRREYLALVGSLILISLEGVIRIITLGLRKISLVLSPIPKANLA
jgi:hypothetical protein